VPEALAPRIIEPFGDRPRRLFVLMEKKVAYARIGEISLVHEIEQRARHGAGRLGEVDEPIDRLGKLGRAARAMPHHAVDEASTRGAAAHDPEIERLWDRIQTEFYDNQRSVVESLHDKGSLRRELDVTRATDILWTLNHPTVYRLLVAERGWTPDEHERWLADLLCSQLLPEGT